jgi:PGF-pre-PGF domain-containing protein
LVLSGTFFSVGASPGGNGGEARLTKGLSEKIKSIPPDENVKVIITLRKPENKGKAKEARDSVKGDIKGKGGHVKREYTIFDGMAAEVPAGKLTALSRNPNVEIIEYDHSMRFLINESMSLINADDVWNKTRAGVNFTGIGQTVCVIDSGVNYSHSFFGGGFGDGYTVIGGYDFGNGDSDPMDDEGHGTHVAGIVASNHSIYRGVAPGAKIIAIRLSDGVGAFSISDVNDGIDWCVGNASTYNISVISMSLSVIGYQSSTYCDSEYPSTASAINTAILNNISVVVATDNEANYAGIGSPACIQNSTRVTATDNSDAFASFANRGGQFDDILAAPGVNIWSVYHGQDNYIQQRSGTSMATPHVSGLVALLNQKYKAGNGMNPTSSYVTGVMNQTAYMAVDTAPPTITIISPTNTTIADTAPLLNVTFNEVVTAWYNINSTTDSTPYENTQNLTLNLPELSRGPNNITVYANDSSGNLNSTTVYFTLTYTVQIGSTNYSTIQEAINAASDGDTITIYPGTITENANVSTSVNIVGVDRMASIVKAGNPSRAIFNITANSVNISSLTLKGANNSYDGAIYSNRANYTNVTGVIFTDIDVYGIEAYKSNFVSIENSVFNESYMGILFNTDSYNGTIINNTFYNMLPSGTSIRVTWGSDTVISNNTISTGEIGIYTDVKVNVTWNNITNTSCAGIYVGDSNSYVAFNRITNLTECSGSASDGIRTGTGSSANTLVNNTITRVTNGKYALSIQGSGNILRNNTVTDTPSKYGFTVTSSNANDIDTTNTINSKIIYYFSSGSNKIIDSSYDPAYLGFFTYANVIVDNVTLNTGITFNDVDNGTITNVTIINSSTGMDIVGDSKNITITNNSIINVTSDTGMYIHDSINLTITNNYLYDVGYGISGGLNNENFSIINNTIIKSRSQAIKNMGDYALIYNNTINGSYMGVWATENHQRIINNTIIGASSGGIEIIYDGTNTTISGNTLINNTYGIAFGAQGGDGASGNNVTNNVINNSREFAIYYDDPSQGPDVFENYVDTTNTIDGGIATIFFNQSGTLANPIIIEDYTLSGTRVTNYGKFMMINSSDFIIRNNTLYNYDLYGIYVSGSTNISLEGNVVNDSRSGIYLINSDGCNLSSNTLSRNNIGAFLANSSGVNITRNILFSNKNKGFYLEGASLFNISYNTVTNSTYGVHVVSTSQGTLHNNTLASNSFYGISLANSDWFNITNNTITGSYFGVYIIQPSDNHNISGNTFSGNYYFDVADWPGSSNTLTGVTSNGSISVGDGAYGIRISLSEWDTPLRVLDDVSKGYGSWYYVMVENLGNVNDTITLSLSPSYGSGNPEVQSGSSLSLDPGEVGYKGVYLNTSNTSIFGIGSYDIEVTATSAGSGYTDTLKLTVIITGQNTSVVALNSTTYLSGIYNSTVSASKINQSFVGSSNVSANSTIVKSSIDNSFIQNSTILNCIINASNITNTTLEGYTLAGAQIAHGNITSGNLTYNNVSYVISTEVVISDFITGRDAEDSSLVGIQNNTLDLSASNSNVNFSISADDNYFGGSLTIQKSLLWPTDAANHTNNKGGYSWITPSANVEEGIDWVYMQIHYNESELGNTSEEDLKFQYFNTTTQKWEYLNKTFIEDFNDVAGWTETGYGFELVDGHYNMTAIGTSLSVIGDNNTAGNTYVSVNMTIANGTTQNGLVIFAYSNTSDFYYAGIRHHAVYATPTIIYTNSSFNWTIGHYNGTWNDLNSSTEAINATAEYTLELFIKDDNVSLYANDNKKTGYNFSNLAFGNLGLGAVDTSVNFDDFVVYHPMSGVNTVENYIWGNSTHFSVYGMSGAVYGVQGSVYGMSGQVITSDPTPTGGGGGAEPKNVTVNATLEDGKVKATFAKISKDTIGTMAIPDDVDVGIKELAIKVKASVINAEIVIYKLDEKPGTVSGRITDEIQTYIQLDETNIKADDIESVAIKFKVPVGWFSEKGIDRSKVALNRYADGKWNTLTATKESEDGSFVYYSATSPGLSVFAVSGESEPEEPILISAMPGKEGLIEAAPAEEPEKVPLKIAETEKPQKKFFGICGPSALLLLMILPP